MSATVTSGSSFAAHVHEVIDLDEHGAVPRGRREVHRRDERRRRGTNGALRVFASSLHTGANVNQEVDGPAVALRTAYAALETAHAVMQARLGTERWVNEGGSLGPEAALLAPLRDASALGSEPDVAASKWSWHDDLREVEHW